MLFSIDLYYQKDFKFCCFYRSHGFFSSINEGMFTGIKIPLYRFGSNSILDDGCAGRISCVLEGEEEESVLDSIVLAQVWSIVNYNVATCRFLSLIYMNFLDLQWEDRMWKYGFLIILQIQFHLASLL